MDEDTSIEAAEHHSCGNETVSEYSRFDDLL